MRFDRRNKNANALPKRKEQGEREKKDKEEKGSPIRTEIFIRGVSAAENRSDGRIAGWRTPR